ncbi:hypothetical protein Trydic_g17878 [Trypoxylus dichotomus]
MSTAATQPQKPSQGRAQQGPSSQPQSSTTPSSKPRPLHPLIEIVDGYKHFGMSKKWHQVMRNVNLMAYSGQVYVLLGPHGSGKTTILNVLLGIYRLNYGEAKVFGVAPGDKSYGCPSSRVGYTPQSNGLFKQMTINETFKYYGRMLQLKSSYINERISYLQDLLALPVGKSLISQCSEGEKRQISFAIAILHEPELLLLDEPCQGVDPVARTNMWDHLMSLIKKGVTIFLTTQNLPDATKADRLGVLRSGYLLMEGTPSELLSNYKEGSLETLYTSIYSLKIRKNMITEKKSIHEHPRVRLERLPASGSEGFFLTVGGHPTNLKVGVVNYEATQEMCRLAAEVYISCQVLDQIDEDIVRTVIYEKYDMAIRDAFDMKISAILLVGEKLTQQLLRTMADIITNMAARENPSTAQLILQIDMTNRIVASAIEHTIKRAVEKYLEKATNDSSVTNATIGYPLRVGKPIFGDNNSADTEFICLGLTVVFLYHLASFLAAVTMVTYRVWNIAIRDYIAGVRIIESILSQMIVYGILLFIEAFLMYAVLSLIRNLSISSALPYLALVIFVQIWCGLCFGFFIASLTRTGVQAGCVVFCCLCASIILCGVLWPLNGQPQWLLTIVKFLPHTQAIVAISKTTLREESHGDNWIQNERLPILKERKDNPDEPPGPPRALLNRRDYCLNQITKKKEDVKQES